MSIGDRFPKVDGPAKADGSGLYADDISFPRMLHAKILRSPHANARIRSIDVSAALAYPGVVSTLVVFATPNSCTASCHADKSTGWASTALKGWREFSPWRVGR